MRIDYRDIDGAMRSRRVIGESRHNYVVKNAYGEDEKIDKQRVLRSFPEPNDQPILNRPSGSILNRRASSILNRRPTGILNRRQK